MIKKEANVPTLRSIAQEVGLTVNTVSLALRNSPLVAADTKLRIQSVAQRIGYIPNALAGSLRSGRSLTAAIVMGDIANPLFAAKIKMLEAAFRERGYHVMIFNTGEDPTAELEAVQTAIGRMVDGLVLCPCAKPEKSLSLMKKTGTPYVLSGRTVKGEDEATVLWDDSQGGYLAAKHLIDCGCRRIAWLGVTQRISSARDRKRGYLRALKEAELPTDPQLVVETSPIGGSVCMIVDQFHRQGIDGICTFSDLLAWETVQCLHQSGLRVPDDIQLTGFDNVSDWLHIPFPLTSVGADLEKEAETTVDMLLERINDRNTPAMVRQMDTWLVVRSSTRGGA